MADVRQIRQKLARRIALQNHFRLASMALLLDAKLFLCFVLFCGYLPLASFGKAAPAASLEISDVTHAPWQPGSSVPVQISARVTVSPARVTLEYQVVEPGKYIALKDAAFKKDWKPVPMLVEKNSENLFQATLPAELQQHRRLIRYRIKAADATGQTATAPGPEDTAPNFAYFVYDGVPAWRGAIDPRSPDPKRRDPVLFDTNAMRRVQAYHFISKKRSVENVTWYEPTGGNEYRYTGTMVVEGKIYDHIRFRIRGGGWRYAMGKNMWKFDFNKGHHLQARDDFGRLYRAKWAKLNLGACIQQGNFGYRGEQGMFESVGFRLFNLAGVEAPRTHWVQLRIIDEPEETPANQYSGDFWGLYLAVENEDGHFLKEHGLPDGNLYKMEGGSGTLSHHGEGAATNRIDLDMFLFAYNSRQRAESWWRTNLDLPRYYSYRAILECIHHYDVGDGKNYDYYRNQKTGRWSVIPWDIDLTWADNMYGDGAEPFKYRVLHVPGFRVEYQNRLREIRDLLFNTNQTWQLLDEYAAIIADPSGAPSPAQADRARWDYHPVMAMGGKAGQGLFYQAAPRRDFAGMVQLMKDYVRRRSAWADALLQDHFAPPAPVLTYTGPPGFPAARLSFSCSPYQGTNAFAALQWRLGEIANANVIAEKRAAPNPYEITPVWESGELTSFRESMTIPPNAAKAGRCYRARVRVKDSNGRWSHWSAPIEFIAGP